MALSIEEMRKRSLQKARAQDEQKAQITARVVSNTKEGRYKAEKQQPQAPAYPKETIQAVSQAASKPFSVNQLTDIFQSGTMKRPALDVERPKVETQQNATTDYDKLLKEKYAQLKNTAPSGNLNDPTRYNLMQEIRQLEQEKKDAEKAGKVSAIDWLGSKAGQFNRGITGALDVVANAIPIAEGALFGVDKDATFTGQLLKPLTTATGKLHEWTSGTTDALNQKVDTAIGDNKALKIASDVGGGIITALPNAALALMSGGTSVPAQLGAQGTGLAATTATALNKLVSNPMFKLSAAQSLGNSFEDAKKAGATDEEALAAAVLTAGANAAVEVGGGIETLPGQLKGADLSTGAKAWNWVKSALDEGKEEVVQGVIQNFVEKGVYDNDKALFSTTDENAVINPGRMMQEFGAGTAVGGILGGGQLVGDLLLNRGKANDPAAAVTQGVLDVEGQKKTATSETITGSPMNGPERSNAAVGTEANIAQEVSPFNEEWQKFLDKHKGQPRVSDYLEFGRQLGEDVDANAFMEFLDQQEQDGKLKWRSDGAPGRVMPAEDHIDQRDYSTVGSPKVKSFQYNNPELRPFIQEGLQVLADDLAHSNPGERYYNGLDPNGVGSQGLWSGQKRHTTPEIAKLKDDHHMSWDAINKAYEDLMEDQGRENNANAKRLELLVDGILTNGHRTLGGVEVPPNQGYIEAKSKIAGYSPKAKPTGGIDEDFMRHEFGDSSDGGTVGDMGAKTSDFKHEVKKSQSHSIENREDFFHVPENQRTEFHHDVVTEKESLHNARLGLDVDYEGEKAQLLKDTTWTGEQVDRSRMIAEDLLSEAQRTGTEEAWQEYRDWRKVMKQHDTELARGLQALAKYARKTGSKIVELASDALENARPGTDNVDVLNTVSDYAEQYDAAAGKKDVDGLVQIIKNTSVTRRTGTFRKNNLPKEIGWALDRIAELAKADLAKPKDANAQQEKPKPVQNYTLKAGDRVTVSDRDNIGTITAANADGTYTIHFKAKSGAEATKTFSADMVTKLGQSKPAVSDPAKTYEVGRFYDFLENFAAAGIEAIATDKQKASFAERAKTFRYNAMLSKVSTVMRNLVGNGVFDPMDSVSRDISVLLDMAISKKTGTRSVAVDKSVFSEAKRTGSMDALAMALMETGLDVNSEGAGSKYERSANRTNKMSGGAFERLMSNWEKWASYTLTVTDEFAKGGISSEVQRGIDRLYEEGKIKDDSLRDAGQQEAKYRTFQDDTKLSGALKKLRNAGNELYDGLGDFVLPFAQVPANLASRALEYSPAGLAKSAVDLARVLKKAENGTLTAAEQAKAVQGIGRGINGSAMIGIAAALALKGLIHVENPGDTDENKDKAAMDKMHGLSGTQWNISATERWAKGEDTAYQDGDVMLSIGFMDPINAMLVTGALVAEDIQSGDASIGSVLKNSFSGTMQAVGDLPVMQTFKNIGNAFRYSDGETWGEKATDALFQFGADQTASFMPNAVKGIAQGLDPYQRDLYTGDTLGEKTLDAWKASIPGLRNTLPIKQDSFGNPMKNEGGVQNFLNTNIRPGQITTYKTNDVMDKITDLSELTGATSVYPSRKAPDNFSVGGENFVLSDEQKTQYQSAYGKTEQDVRAALIVGDLYKNLDTDGELKAHTYAEDYAKQVAKEAVNPDYEQDTWVAELQGKSPEEVAEAIVMKSFEALANNKKQYENKYIGISGLATDGMIDNATAAALFPDSMRQAYYDHAEKSGVTAQQWAEAYGHAMKLKGSKEEQRAAALDYINGMDMPTVNKTALAKGLFAYMYDIIPKEVDLPKNWLG